MCLCMVCPAVWCTAAFTNTQTETIQCDSDSVTTATFRVVLDKSKVEMMFLPKLHLLRDQAVACSQQGCIGCSSSEKWIWVWKEERGAGGGQAHSSYFLVLLPSPLHKCPHFSNFIIFASPLQGSSTPKLTLILFDSLWKFGLKFVLEYELVFFASSCISMKSELGSRKHSGSRTFFAFPLHVHQKPADRSFIETR